MLIIFPDLRLDGRSCRTPVGRRIEAEAAPQGDGAEAAVRGAGRIHRWRSSR